MCKGSTDPFLQARPNQLSDAPSRSFETQCACTPVGEPAPAVPARRLLPLSFSQLLHMESFSCRHGRERGIRDDLERVRLVGGVEVHAQELPLLHRRYRGPVFPGLPQGEPEGDAPAR